jgi:DNA-binding transcriptional LysR family regulator
MRAIADEGSFTGAALSLGYSQPAISQMVRRLEQRTGTVLVERVGRSVRLTEAGQVLARHAVGVLAALDAAEEEVAAIAGLRAGRVRLMAFPSSSATLVPRALALVRRRFPDIVVSFTEAEPPESLAALRAGECDLAVAFAYEGTDLGRGEEDLDSFVTHKLLDDEVRIGLPIGHRLADEPVVRIADLAAETWIAGCPRCRGHLLHLCETSGFSPTVGFETEDYVAVHGFVAAGLGIALFPDLILRSTTNPQIVVRPIEPSSRRAVHVVTTADLQRVPAVRATLEALCESARATVGATLDPTCAGATAPARLPGQELPAGPPSQGIRSGPPTSAGFRDTVDELASPHTRKADAPTAVPARR